MSTRHLLYAALAVGATSFGCAHEQRPMVTQTSPILPAAPVVAKAAQPDESLAAAQRAKDLQALLQGGAIRFGFNEDVLTSESQARLSALSDALRANPAAKIQIAGNCDDRGTEEYNLALGQRRADVAKHYLVTLGVDAARIDTISYGFERPADPANTEQAWALNRRDELSARN